MPPKAHGRTRGALLVGVVATAAALFALAGPGTGTAHAAQRDAVGVTASGACHGHKVHTLRFRTGKVVVYKSGAWVCAMTLAKDTGERRRISVTVQARGHRAVTEAGQFKRYAGPLTVRAGNRCIKVSGSVAGSSASSRWILC